MIHNAKLSKGLDRIRDRFLVQLVDRRELILRDTLSAVETDDPIQACKHLNAVSDVLHQIAGTAGTLGFAKFGLKARAIEQKIENKCLLSTGEHASVELMQEIIDFSELAMQLTKRR